MQNPPGHQQPAPQLGLQGRCGIAFDPAIFAKENLAERLVDLRSSAGYCSDVTRKAVSDTTTCSPGDAKRLLSSYSFLHPGPAVPAGSCWDTASVFVVRVVWGDGHTLGSTCVLRVDLCVSGESSMIMEIELQSQVLDAMNYVLYDQLKFKGNRMDYYNALNLYMHQVNVGELKQNNTYFFSSFLTSCVIFEGKCIVFSSLSAQGNSFLPLPSGYCSGFLFLNSV